MEKLPYLARQDGIPKRQWETVVVAAEDISELFSQVHSAIDEHRPPDYASVAKSIQEAIERLQGAQRSPKALMTPTFCAGQFHSCRAPTGFEPGKDVVLVLDPAASELCADGQYVFYKSDHSTRSSEQMIALYQRWIASFPIWSIEDGLAENDWVGWQALTQRLGDRVQLIGDDIFVTNPAIIRRGVPEGIGNAALIKLNQIGTVSETLEAITVARQGGFGTVVSHRSGETTDDFIADFAVATSAGQIKTGAPCRGERVTKYNQLLRIGEVLGPSARYAGASPFVRTKGG
ncbi:MAG TPA: hypothetical protein VG826_34615 [Pirellulales bacterium]|nr:hypothetical protein [Pirellulales bacterium]